MQRHFRLTFCPCFKMKKHYPSRVHQDDRSTQFADLQANIINRARLSTSVAVDTSQSVPMPQGMVLKDEPYVVHTSVDYTNCLVPALDRITAAPYYWGVMDRFEAEELLEDKPEGTFLLRDSAQSEYLFSVSFRRYKRTLHARIEQKNHRFSFDFSDTSVYSADTITHLIAYYKDPSKCMFFEPQLSIPLPRNFPFSLQEICRARIATMTTFDGVQKLTLPSILKEFVREYYYKHPVKMIDHIPRTDQIDVSTSQLRTS